MYSLYLISTYMHADIRVLHAPRACTTPFHIHHTRVSVCFGVTFLSALSYITGAGSAFCLNGMARSRVPRHSTFVCVKTIALFARASGTTQV